MSEAVVKIDLAKRLSGDGPIKIELGCGKAKLPDRIGIDAVDLPNVDIVANLNEGLSFLPDNSVDEVHSHSLLEHIDNFELLMSEIVRVLKPTGTCYTFVPHFSNPFYFSDPTHVRFFGLYTFYYFVDESKQLRRKVPAFYWGTRIEIVKIKLKFTSEFRLIRMARKLFSTIVNSSSTLQELYEDSFTNIVPCYGMQVTFKPVKPSSE